MARTLIACDLFAGSGGFSTALVQACEAAGLRLQLTALNHWDVAQTQQRDWFAAGKRGRIGGPKRVSLPPARPYTTRLQGATVMSRQSTTAPSHRPQRPTPNCVRCGAINPGGQRYCTRRCYDAERKRLVDRVCPRCSKPFQLPQYKVNQNIGVYCSRDCFRGEHITSKKCARCGIEHPIAEFKGNGRLRGSYCGPCRRAKHRAFASTIQGRFTMGRVRAKGAGIPWSIPKDEYAAIVALPCHYCGKKLDQQGVGLDQIEPGLGYLPTNVVPCCGRCNMVKGDHFTFAEMLRLSAVIREIDQGRLAAQGGAA